MMCSPRVGQTSLNLEGGFQETIDPKSYGKDGPTVKKMLVVLCSFALICAMGLSTVGCGKKDDKGKTTGTGPATGTPATTTK